MAFRGGSYRDINRLPHGGNLHCHRRIPKDCLRAAGLDPRRGPVIQMVDEDHKGTDTWGMGKEASAARARITDMLRRGDFDGAFEAGVADVRAGSGDRYDDAIAEARRYFPSWRRMATTPSDGAASTTGAPAAQGQVDVTLLVQRLTHYLEALDRHNLAIQQAYDQACGSLANLQRVWGGEAAREFYTRFGSSIQAMERYLEGARQIREILEERLASLREADRPGV